MKNVSTKLSNSFPISALTREGLYYYGARYMDPRTSRWLSADPALEGYLPEAPASEAAQRRNGSLPGMGGVFNPVNLAGYTYAGNNPMKYTDPTGLGSVDQEAEQQQQQKAALDQDQGGKWTPEPRGEYTRDVTPGEGLRILQKAESYLGDPYLSGGDSHSGIDCSNLVANAINEAGIPYEATWTKGMAANPVLRPIEASEARAGDIMLWSEHAGFYNPSQGTTGKTLLRQRQLIKVATGLTR
jgi:cell wall-associated NlpC family hydrolase